MNISFLLKSFFNLRLLIFLLLAVLSASQANAEQRFWGPADPPKAHYKINASLDISTNVVKGSETVTFKNSSREPLSILAVDWTIKDTSSIEIELDGRPLSLINVEKKPPISPPLLYALTKPIKPGASIRLTVKFNFGVMLGPNLREIKLIKWFPRLWWDGLPTHDSFEAKLDVPSGYALAASGLLNRKTGYYENSGVKTFGIYLGKDMKTEERNVDGVLITSLFTEKGSECARFCLDTATDVVKFYKNWLGFYPFKFLYIIPGASSPMGGYPFASGIVVIHGQERFEDKPLLHWQWIMAHEIGHEYWGEYVMDDDAPPWLWIGMGIYADREYTQSRNLGRGEHERLMNTYIGGVRKNYDTTIDIPRSLLRKINFSFNNVVIHGKGFSVISALESVLGKETFERIYQKCLKEYGRKRLGYKEFWRMCEEETGQSLRWFFDQWVRTNKYLYYEVVFQESIKEKDGYVSHVKVESLGSLKMPVHVKAVFEDGSTQTKFTNRLFNVNNLRFESKSKLKEAILDPDKKLAMVNTPYSSTPEGLSELISQLPWSGAGEDALRAFEKANSIKFDQSSSWFKLGLTLFDGGYYKQSFDAFQRTKELKPSQMTHFSALVWMGHLKDLEGKREEAIKYYKEALKYDTGRTQRHDQWGMKINRQWVEDRLKTPFKWGKK